MAAIDDQQLRTLLKEGVSQREIARRLGIPRSTLQDYMKRLQPVEVHRGTPAVIPRHVPRPPEVDPAPQTLAALEAIKVDLLEVAQWWRTRKMRRVDSGGPRETQRWTVHVEKRWIAAVKEEAEAEGVSQAAIVDRALRQYFEGR
jgi:DNA-binding Lrp family transcriptional regulator